MDYTDRFKTGIIQIDLNKDYTDRFKTGIVPINLKLGIYR